jgi:hypothetical protein
VRLRLLLAVEQRRATLLELGLRYPDLGEPLR